MIKERNEKGDDLPNQNYETRSDKSKMESDLLNPNIANFDQGKIIEHYRRMKETQYHHLATLNMSEQLKKKLFGFSDGYYVTNDADPANLIVFNHPMQGRIIMTKQKYRHEELSEHRKREINWKEDPNNSVSQVFSGQLEGRSSSVQEIFEGPGEVMLGELQKSESNLIMGGIQSV